MHGRFTNGYRVQYANGSEKHYCYRNGQADAMLQQYNERQAMLATQRGLDILKTLM